MKVTPGEQSKGSFKEKRSEFIAVLAPVSSVDHVTQVLKRFRKKYHSASHICWAYCINVDESLIENSSDGGEPAGTAGIPILNVLRKNQIVNGALYVIRYFGGVKLGKRGLINAYKKGAELAVDHAKLEDWSGIKILHLKCPLDFYGKLSNLLDKFKGKVLNDNSGGALCWKVEMPAYCVDLFCEQVDLFTKGQATWNFKSAGI